MEEKNKCIMLLDDNKKYVIINTLSYNNKNYILLSELNNFENYIIGEIINDEVILVEDENLVGQLIIEFSKLGCK